MTAGVDPGHEDAGDEHRPGHGQAVGNGKAARSAELEHDKENSEEQCPVDESDVYLRLPFRRRILDPEDRHDPRGDPLIDEREHPADHCLGGDDRGGNAQDKERDIQEPRLVEYHFERNVFCFGVSDNERALSEIVQDEGGEDEYPAFYDGLASKMAHIRIERFAPRSAEDHFGEDEKAGHAVAYQE